jgi:ATP-dependent DNA helicase RecG
MAKRFDKRKFMLLAIKEMKKSISEPRKDKLNPNVGAVLVSPNGTLIDSAHRGEMRYGDHAEYTLLERKNRTANVTGHYLFATLEPCAPGARKHPKLGCAERIVNARIKKVWIGIEDPDPTVDRKGIQYLLDSGVEVEMFDEDLQEQVIKENKSFLFQAKKRVVSGKVNKIASLTPLEDMISNATLDEFSPDALHLYISRANLKMTSDGKEFKSLLERQQFIQFDQKAKKYRPTGLGVLLFGKDPSQRFPQAVFKVEVRHGKGEPELHDFSDALVLIPDKIEEWLKRTLSSTISRKGFARTTSYSYPMEVLREATMNALVHRDYDIKGAKSYFQINEETITVKSPGLPVDPIRLKDFQEFKAPSLSRNPKIMSVFSKMGYVEERGIGMLEMKSLPEKHHLPKPDVRWKSPFLTITFPRNDTFLESIMGSNKLGKLNDEEKLGIVFVRDTGEISKSDYAKHFGFSDKKAQRHLAKFLALAVVASKGKGPTTKYVFKKTRKN